MLRRQSNGQLLNYGSQTAVGVGGEARILQIREDPGLLAKVYHNPTAQHARKLAAMIANPPVDPMAAKGHVSIAWPVDLVETADGRRRFVGFLMPYVTWMRPIIEYYNPRTRHQQCPLFNYQYLHRTARNLAVAVGALHVRGYVIGDVNETNILVNDTALVTLVDTDSFQVRDPKNGHLFRCPVGTPLFTPPEFQNKAFAHIDRAPENDLFGLAVLIFQILMEGAHPFAGQFTGRGDPPPYEVRISLGHFPHGNKPRGPYRPAPVTLPFEVLDPKLQQLFLRSFVAGHGDPQARPGTQEWLSALIAAEDALTICTFNDQHLYGNHLRTCPWCERTRLLRGRDPFPSRTAMAHGQHQQPIPVTQAPLPPAGGQPTGSLRPHTLTTPRLAPRLWMATITPVVRAFLRPAPGWQRTFASLALMIVGFPLMFVVMYLTGLISAGQPATPDASKRPAPIDVSTFITNSVGMKLALINPGEFLMGSPDTDKGAEDDEKPQHRVRITRPFYLGVHEVTRGQFRRFVDDSGYQTEAEKDGKGGWGWNEDAEKLEQNPRYTWLNPGFEQTDLHPVVNVSWNDAVAFAEWLGKKEGKTYRLPTEAEWEYACRAGTTTRYFPGDDAEGLAEVGNVADGTSREKYPGWNAIAARDGFVYTAPVGRYRPNAWGLHDMHGNVWEWCWDWYGGDFYKASRVDDPAGPLGAADRVIRGGSWSNFPRDCRSAYRYRSTPVYRSHTLGFRLALVQ